MVKDFIIKEEKYFINAVFNRSFGNKYIIYSTQESDNRQVFPKLKSAIIQINQTYDEYG